MENNNISTTQTTTVVETNKDEVELISIRYPVFLMFAEYLGYVSPLLDWAQELCEGKEISSFKRKILMIDAKSILTKMLDECPRENLVSLYNDYYDILLGEYDDNVIKLEKARTDDLPF